jgi:hypothetical protein
MSDVSLFFITMVAIAIAGVGLGWILCDTIRSGRGR